MFINIYKIFIKYQLSIDKITKITKQHYKQSMVLDHIKYNQINNIKHHLKDISKRCVKRNTN